MRRGGVVYMWWRRRTQGWEGVGGWGRAGEMRMEGGTIFWEICGAGRRCGRGVGGSAVTTHMRW